MRTFDELQSVSRQVLMPRFYGACKMEAGTPPNPNWGVPELAFEHVEGNPGAAPPSQTEYLARIETALQLLIDARANEEESSVDEEAEQ